MTATTMNDCNSTQPHGHVADKACNALNSTSIKLESRLNLQEHLALELLGFLQKFCNEIIHFFSRKPALSPINSLQKTLQ